MKLVWSVSALHQFVSLQAYIAADNPDAADRIADRVSEAAERLVEFPEMGSSDSVPGTPKLVVAGTRYLITYKVTETQLVILNVWHGSQNWRRRE